MTVTITIPTLETDRLILRAPGAQDSDAFTTFFGSERSRMVGGPVDAGEAWRHLGSVIGHWGLRGYGRWIVEERSSGAPCGLVGLHYPLHWPEPELGWFLFEGFEGRGIATEAAQTARDYAYERVGLPTLISLIDPTNAASVTLAQRIGAERDGEFSNRGNLLQIWRHPSPSRLANDKPGAA